MAELSTAQLSAQAAQLEMALEGLDRHGRLRLRSDGRVALGLPERLPPVSTDPEDGELLDVYACQGGEHLTGLAVLYYKRYVTRPTTLAPIIALAQDDPIADMKGGLPPGLIVMIPSMEYIRDVAYGDSLAETPEIL